MKYYAAYFTSKSEPTKRTLTKPFFYASNLNLEVGSVYNIESSTMRYSNPVVVTGIIKNPPLECVVIKKAEKIAEYERYVSPSLTPKKIYFNPEKETTAVLWKNGDKTVVKCCEHDIFDFESGFVAALAKRIYGKSGLKKIVKEFIEPQAEEYYQKVFNIDTPWDLDEE